VGRLLPGVEISEGGKRGGRGARVLSHHHPGGTHLLARYEGSLPQSVFHAHVQGEIDGGVETGALCERMEVREDSSGWNVRD
jgi:hypothetical protein